MNKLIYLLPIAAACIGCSHKTASTAADSQQTINYTATIQYTDNRGGATGGSKYLPKASAFRMSGDYAGNVAVTLGSDGKLIYFPAPSDISRHSKPTDLGDGWWLNNQGISENSVFTRYTFEEYSQLPAAPSAEDLKKAIIPGARILKMVRLPYTVDQAAAHTEEIKEYLRNEK